MKRISLFVLVAAVALLASAAAPNGSGTYYQNANGKKGAQLKTALCGIIYNRTEKTYKYLWTAFHATDVRSDGKIWDMYSDKTNYVPGGSAQGANYSVEGDSYNREHSFPASWFGSNAPMYTDLHHIYPTDGFVNNKRANYPFGTTNGNSYKSHNSFSKLGSCTYSGYTGTVFEPADEYKGDFARTYFYMVTCYEEKLKDWYNDNADGVRATIDGSTYPGFTTWQLNMLLAWAAADPVSDKEVARNNAVYGIQNNRNPFIDYPGLEQYIWGSKTNDTFSYNNYVVPEGYSSGSGGGGTTPTGGNTITISYSDIPDGYTATTGTSGSLSKTVATSNDLTVLYSGINTKSSEAAAAHAYGYAMFLKNYGYIYNSTAPNGYYPSKVTATFSSSTGTSGKVGINFGTSALTTRNSSVTGSVSTSGIFEQTNTDESKLYWNFSTTSANVQVTKIEVVYSPILSDPVTYNTPTTKTYGETFTLVNGTHFTTDGTVTLSSSNEAVATVSGLTVTPVAAGDCIISVTYGAGTNYKASNSAFIFTVTQPAGKETAAPSTETVFTETFAGSNGNSGWSGNAASGPTVGFDNNGWSKFYTYGNDGSIRIGKGSGQGHVITPALGTAGDLTLRFKSGAWDGDKTTGGLVLSVEAGGGTLSTTTFDLSNARWTTYSTTITGATAETRIKFSAAQSDNNRFFLDDVVVTKPGVTLTQKLNNYGYASYCSEYPLDFSDYESAGYSAWQVTGVSGETITFAQVTGTVKGGTGLILKGIPNATITLHSAASTTTLDDNLLVGTIVNTYAETGQYFGLKGNAFVPVAESIVPAGKALLPASLITSNEVKALNFVFEEDATGISLMEDGRSQMEDGAIYKQGSTIVNLAGQRLDNSQLKRGIYIVNGKKILK